MFWSIKINFNCTGTITEIFTSYHSKDGKVCCEILHNIIDGKIYKQFLQWSNYGPLIAINRMWNSRWKLRYKM